MDEVKLLTHNSIGSLDSIKMAALYFDKIKVSTFGTWYYKPEEGKKGGKLKYEYRFYEPTFIDHLHPLIKANIVEMSWEPFISFDRHSPIKTEQGTIRGGTFSNVVLSDIVMGNSAKYFEPDAKEVWTTGPDGNKLLHFEGEEVEEVKYLKKAFSIEKNKGLRHYSEVNLWEYFGTLLNAALKGIDEGKNILTTSGVLDEFLRIYFVSHFFTDTKKQLHLKLNVNPKIAFEAIKFNVPNLSRLSSEDVLEVRYKMNDELTAFKTYLTNLQLDLDNNFDLKYISSRSKEIVEAKINPALQDITSKLKDIQLGTLTTILKEIKDPKSYSPLILTMTNDISSSYAILVSLGLMTLNTAIDHFKSKKEIKRNGLYYLLKLKERN